MSNKATIRKFEYTFPNYVTSIYNLFRQNGYPLFLVGGSVRDMLMNRQPDDYDFCGPATADEIIRILESNSIEYDDSYTFLGYVIAYCDGEKVDILTYHGNSMYDDAASRDFTMNALYYDIGNKEILDFFTGYEDIHNHIIRAVSPDKLQNKEYLRAIRFALEFEFHIDPITYEHMQNNMDCFDTIRTSSVKREFTKILKYGERLFKCK